MDANATPAVHVNDCRSLIDEVRKTYQRNLEAHGITDPVVISNNSGGKDSGATDLLANEITDGNFRSVNSDTGNESALTIAHLKNWHLQRGGDPVEMVSADYPQELFDIRRERVIEDWDNKQMVHHAVTDPHRYQVCRSLAHGGQTPRLGGVRGTS